MRRNSLYVSLIVLLAIAMLAGACGQGATPAPTAPAAPAAPVATQAPILTAAPVATAAVAAGAERGACGTLRLLWWQAPTILNPHLAQGTKDWDASRIVYEPLAGYNSKGELDVAYGLAAEVPTAANGGIAADGLSITWKLKQGVVWSDGKPFTADDVLFTWKYVSDPATAATTVQTMKNVKDIEKVDDHTVKIIWKAANPTPYETFTGIYGMILPKHVFEPFIGAAAVAAEVNLKPVGTNAFVLREFSPGDVAVFDANPTYRDAKLPCFKEVILKGGGDAASAARAVLETGDADYGWNLQVAADVLQEMMKAGKGELVGGLGGNTERLVFQRADPNPDLGDERAEPNHPHPFLTDLNVRKALALAVDRETIVKQLYGDGLTGRLTCNYLPGPPQYASDTKFDTCEFNIEKANKLLDDAGWVRGSDGIRAKDGVRMSMILQTSVNALRQKEQEIIKAGWQQIGVETELKSVQASVFFSRDVSNPDTYFKLFADAEIYGYQPAAPDDPSYMALWTCGEIKTRDASWSGWNMARYCNPEYDKVVADLMVELDAAKRLELYKKANDILIQDVVMVPLANKFQPFGAKSVLLKNVDVGPADTELWNLAAWTNK